MSFDIGKLEVTGPPIRVVKDVLMTDTGNAQFSVSDNGSLIYVSNDSQAYTELWSNATIVWVDHDGREEEVLALPGLPRSMRISPDGKSLAATNVGRLATVWLYDLERGTGRPISEGRTFESWPIWTPDGRGIVYHSNRAGGPMLNLFLWHMDESITPQQLTDRTFRQQPETWSADGKTLIFTEAKFGGTGSDILQLTLDGDSAQPLVATPFYEGYPTMSPNGQWLAYTSDVSGRYEVFVQRYPDSRDLRQVSTGGGNEPLWAPDGGEIYYRSGGAVMAVSVQDDGNLRLGEPRLLFGGRYFSAIPGRNDWALNSGRSYDLSPDGSRFLMLRYPEFPPPPRQFVVVVNWLDELKRIMESD